MTLKATHPLTDNPAQTDEFGTHQRIATLIEREILDSSEGRSIAIVGEWGSGKSTIITLLEKGLAARQPTDSHVFIYDAWAHQGDQLRRAFLDDFISSLRSKERITEVEKAEATERVWNRVETTTTTVEPVLRRHAKWLLFTLALLPLGLKFFEIPADKDFYAELIKSRNLVAMLLLLALPISIGVFGLILWKGSEFLKDHLFGESHKDPSFSVLSFFFEKTQGKAERKRIKSPADSIGEFRDAFVDLVAVVHSHCSNLRLVIVIDNIDRIPPDQARDFWSTMQTFFGDAGGHRRSTLRKYWLVAPFSVEALSFTFQEKGSPSATATNEAKAKARSYIDKTFGLAFYVPPPILANWRRYLLDRLIEAFPEHDQTDLVGVRDLYDYSLSSTSSIITPRSMKLFVNSLIVAYRQRGNDVPLPVMAAYVLHRDKIKGIEITDDFLTAADQRVIKASNWRALIGALHFDVSPEEATQLLLQEPILASLRENSAVKLKQEETRSGFFDVLPRIVHQELDSATASDGLALANIAVNIDALADKANPALNLVWRNLGLKLQASTAWGGFEHSPLDGITATLAQIPEGARDDLRKAVLASISKAPIAEADKDISAVKVLATKWLDTAAPILLSIADRAATTVSIPGSPIFNLEVLQQLVVRNIGKEDRQRVKASASADNLRAAIVGHIGSGNSIEQPDGLIDYLRENVQPAIPWGTISTAISERLRAPIANVNEFNRQLRLLLSLAVKVDPANATAILKELSALGFLPHYFFSFRDNLQARAEIVVAALISNPAYERNGEFQNSSNGDTQYKELIAQAEPEPTVVDATAKIFIALSSRGRLLDIATAHANLRPLAIAVLTNIVENPGDRVLIAGTAQAVFDSAAVLYEQRAKLPLIKFFARLSERQALITLLISKPFDANLCFMYLTTFASCDEANKNAYATYLVNGIDSLDTPTWEIALVDSVGTRRDVIALCNELRIANPDFYLKATTRDAILNQIRKVGEGKVAASEQLSKNIVATTALLDVEIRDSLDRDVVDDLDNKSGSYISQTLTLLKSEVKMYNGKDEDRVLRRVFFHILTDPTEVAVNWMNQLVGSRSEFLAAVSKRKSDVESRLEKALAKEGLAPETLAALQHTGELLGISEETEGKGESGKEVKPSKDE